MINDHPNVRTATRERVLRTIEGLDFRPNRAARALSLGRTQSVTVLTSNTTLYGRAAIMQGIEEAARAAGFAVGVFVLDSPKPANVRAAVEQACDPTGGGVIVIAYDLAGVRALGAIPHGVPVAATVEVTQPQGGGQYPSVWLDDRAAAADAVRYLLDLGHPTVHYVAIPSSIKTSARTEGWRSALETAKVPVPEPIPGGWTPESGYRAGQRLAADQQVSAVLCGNDDLALGVLCAMREAGRAVPGDVSVVGFDDAPQSAFLAPALTTVRLDFVGLGRDCFAVLQNSYSDGEVSPTPIASAATQPELIVRASSGPPRR